jgi:hypothetical protein
MTLGMVVGGKVNGKVMTIDGRLDGTIMTRMMLLLMLTLTLPLDTVGMVFWRRVAHSSIGQLIGTLNGAYMEGNGCKRRTQRAFVILLVSYGGDGMRMRIFWRMKGVA